MSIPFSNRQPVVSGGFFPQDLPVRIHQLHESPVRRVSLVRFPPQTDQQSLVIPDDCVTESFIMQRIADEHRVSRVRQLAKIGIDLGRTGEREKRDQNNRCKSRHS